MIISNALTPLSRSVVLASAWTAHRRHVQQLGLPTISSTEGDSAQAWNNVPLSEVVAELWGTPSEQIAHLLALPSAPEVSPLKPAKAIKSANELLADWEGIQSRLRAWAARVQKLTWRQADLLQVMEEIEPNMADAFRGVQGLAVAGIGSYAYVQALLDRHVKATAPGLSLSLVAGLQTPELEQVESMAQGVEPQDWRERYGHHSQHALELAWPRLRECPLDQLVFTGREGDGWNPLQARRAREQAVKDAVSSTGFLQRSNMRKAIALVQDLLVNYSEAVNTLDYVLDTTRRWCLAAAHEAQHNGLIDDQADIFSLELEEIKQVMTGEWHSREQVQPLIASRRANAEKRNIGESNTRPLGIAGNMVEARAYRIPQAADSLSCAPNGIALVEDTGITWTALYLRAGGILAAGGDFLSHTARVARAGGLPAIVAAGTLVTNRSGQVIRLDPGQNQAN